MIEAQPLRPYPRATTRALLGLYNLVWPLAMPALALSRRMRDGWRERVLLNGPEGPVDIWMQAASAGEAYLAEELLMALPDDKPLRVLVTSGTRQGMDILAKACEKAASKPMLATRQAFFPLDMPALMDMAMKRFSPRLMVILETELWPGLLWAARKNEIPAIIVNGRMSASSLGGYMAAGSFLRDIAPERVLAIAGTSAKRFSLVFGSDRVEEMQNIKFDRCPLEAAQPAPDAPVARILGNAAPLAIFGSVRSKEETEVVRAIARVREARPDALTALFPRHMHRLDFWAKALYEAGLPVVLRSQLTETPPAGTTVLWDAFGELGAAYGFASAAFVGGSLHPLGGQNFLEPLIHGVTPVIGPHWKNFDWIGREIIDCGLVHEVTDADALADQLIRNLNQPEPRESVRDRATRYIAERRGGTAQAAACIARYL
ncbi:3-deoxy-D-manno-octulosonic-acid transferase [Desulfobaculum xiamenense]|uniref:3-deoxy-D-manno-octulosonic acid transferase n=1 Tax=Desulfobaculum xiamenense TaxID=995050 RepID=A0A846QPC0_9BACT|nr:glycosyltransferase N-terminal domain-containing protein [Desulfobaculum xiamenense]NJB67064.1 3-deoxy-D-manno-octulosonic-acid transferase [Desulfobaculum xiamenense]